MEKTTTPFLRVFVYGTLKRGFGNHRLLDGVEFAGTGVVYGRLHGAGVPAVKLAPRTAMATGTGDFDRDLALQTKIEGCPPPAPGRGGWSHVRGEIYHVRRPGTLARLDRLEGFAPGRDSFYTRTLVSAETDVGAKPVWVYGANAPRAPRLTPRPGESEVYWTRYAVVPELPPLREGKHWVFAYGSLLSGRDARRTAPQAWWRGRAFLPEHRLALTKRSSARAGGVADVVPAAHRGVWGGLYEVGRRGLALLDAREGHPVVYRRRLATVWVDGRPDASVDAWVYQVVNREAKPIPASATYKSLIVRGARERDLPRAYIRGVIASLPVRAAPVREPVPARKLNLDDAAFTGSGLFPDWED